MKRMLLHVAGQVFSTVKKSKALIVVGTYCGRRLSAAPFLPVKTLCMNVLSFQNVDDTSLRPSNKNYYSSARSLLAA